MFEEFRFEYNWEKYYDMHQHEKATKTTQYYNLAADEDPGLIEAMSLSFQMRMDTMSLESERLASAANHAWFSTLSAMEGLPGMFVRAPGILYSRSETDFVCICMETEWQRLRAGLDELLRRTAMGEHAYWTSDEVAGVRAPRVLGHWFRWHRQEQSPLWHCARLTRSAGLLHG